MVDAVAPAIRAEEMPDTASPLLPEGPGAAQPEAQAPDEMAEIVRLAGLHPVPLALQLPGAAKQLGVPAATLRRAVADESKRRRAERAERDGTDVGGNNAAVPDADSAPAIDPRGRADLFVNAADLPDTAAELADRLAARPHLFDRGGPVRLAFDAQRGGDGGRAADGQRRGH